MIILTLALLLVSSVASAQQLAFPTAEGWGRFATGGRGGYVCHVTSTGITNTGALVGDGPHRAGTFEYCGNQTGARTIVFDVAGTITYSGTSTDIVSNNVTVAAQTAPGDGIMLKGVHLYIEGDHSIVRFIRVRPGLAPTPVIAYNLGGIIILEANNVIVDHCSVSWVPDDSLSSWGSQDITYQWCISAEGLRQTNEHPTTGVQSVSRGKCLIMGRFDHQRGSGHHNACINQADRSPNAYNNDIQYVNNLIYNSEPSTTTPDHSTSVKVEYIKNYFLPGPTENGRILSRGYPSSGVTQANHNASRLYVLGNYHPTRRPTGSEPEDAIIDLFSGTTRIPDPGARMHPAIDSERDALTAKNEIMAKVGAIKPVRDAIDQALIQDVIDGTGASNPTSIPAPGYIAYNGTNRDLDTYDTDRDGIPNAWETACSSAVNTASTNHTGLSNSDEDDGALIVSSTGYSALEHYLNEVAGDYADGSCGGLLTGGDTTPPTGVAIIAPTESQVISGTSQNYEATATDGESVIIGVDFYQNGLLIASDTGAPDCGSNYCIALDTTLLVDGNKTFHVIATSEGGPTQSADVHVVVDNITGYIAVHASGAPTINGILTEFSGANPVSLGPAGETDLRLMWDSTALYIGATTTDAHLAALATSHDTITTPQIYNDDAIEIVIDTDNDGVWETTDYKFIINAAGTTWDARNLTDLTYEPAYSKGVILVNDLNDGADDTSWTIEIAIPWAQMGGITPSAGQVYGINVQIDDLDASRTAYRWNGAINKIEDAQDVELGPDTGTDTEDPTNVAVIDPVASQFISGIYAIRATAQDDVGIDHVTFYEGANILCTDDTPSGGVFNCAWDTTQEIEGSFNLKVNACDTAGTPNCVDSPVISVTIDNTGPSNPSNLTLSSNVDDQELLISLDWTASTDAFGPITYNIERCSGQNCSIFAEIDTSTMNDYFDNSVLEHTDYCYRVLAIDAALNPSESYSNTACIKTMDITFVPLAPTLLQTTALSTVSFPTEPTDVGTSALGTIAGPTLPTGVGTTADPTITFPSPATGVTSP